LPHSPIAGSEPVNGKAGFSDIAPPDIRCEVWYEVLVAKLRSVARRPLVKPNGRQTATAGPLKVLAAGLLVILIGFIPYRPVLGYFFTGTDTLTLIETSRVESSEDVARILVKPLMWGSDFIERARFYRPIAALSYSLDYSLWGLNPFGYHVTNVGLHLLVLVLILLVVVELTNGDLMAGFVSALVFALHPILAETVPAPDHRHDIMAGLFLLLSFLLFLKSRRLLKAEKAFTALAVTSYFLALGAKEIAIVLPGTVFTYLILFSPAASPKTRIADAVKGTAVYLLATAAYLLWRVYVLGNLGGYAEAGPGFREFVYRMQHIIVSYAADLLYPHDVLAIFSVLPREPVMASLLGFLGLWLIICTGRSAYRSAANAVSYQRKLALFLACWLVLPLGVFILSSTFNHRSMYTCAIPYSILLGLLLVLSARSLRRPFHLPLFRTTRVTDFRPILKDWRLLPVGLLGVGLVAGHVLCSPLMQSYDQWNDCSRMTRILLSKLNTLARTFTIDTTIQIQNLPSFITRYEMQTPRAREVGYLNDYSIKSWLDLCYPGNRMKVVVLSRFSPEIAPDRMHLQVWSEATNAVRLCIGFPGTKGRCFPPLE
jgi:hypothetical protein